jgi:hypothetical protein
MKNLKIIGVLLATAIATGYLLNNFLKKAGLDDIFDFDLFEEEIDVDQN